MSTSVNIVSGLGIPSQIPLNPKQNSASEATLKDLGLNDNLAFTYEQGLIVYCRLEGTRYEWREVESGEELTGLRDTDFIYPDGTITDNVDYSNKKYNFFPVITTVVPNEVYIEQGDNITITGSGVELDPFIINGLESPLNQIDEGNGNGIVIRDRVSGNYGNIGLNAVDFSYNDTSSSTKGATGENSFSVNKSNTSSGENSFSGGLNNISSGLNSFSFGENNESNNTNSISLGSNIISSGISAIGIGKGLSSKSFFEIVLGSYNSNYTPISTSTWSITDRLFTIGNGFNEFNKSDALLIYKNGLALLPSVTNSLIENATGKAIVTREYLESILPSTVDGSETKLVAGTNITITGNGTTLTPYNISYDADDISQYTDEMARDAVGTILQNTSTITFNYDDVLEIIEANVNINASSTSTGILSGGGLSIGTLNTLWSIQAGEGYIYNSLLNTTTHITWDTQEDLVATYLNTNISTYILIDNLGEIVQQTTAPTQQQLRTHIYIGKLAHATLSTILAIVTEPSRMFDISGQIGDLNRAIGPVNVGGGNVINHNGSNLTISATAGGTYRPGSNYSIDRNSPSITSEPQVLAPTFRRKYRNGSGGWVAVNATTIDPDRYDNNSGTLVTVPTGKFTVQVLWRFGNTGTIHVDYGQTYYDTLEQARASIGGAIVTQDPDNVRDAVKRGWLIVKQNTNVLNNSSDAVFIQADKFGERGATGAIPSLQSAYKNSLSPEIETDSVLGAFSLKRGSASDTDNVFEIINGSGVITSTIKGNGALTALTYNGFNPTTDLRNINTTSPLLGGGNLTVDRTLSIQQATTSQDGYLSSTDWNIFNNKQNNIGFTPENETNKQDDFTTDGTGTKYPTLDLLSGVNDRLLVVENFNPPPQSGFTGTPVAVWSGVGLIYNYVFPVYYLDGVEYPAVSGSITLTAADATYPRFTTIIADASGVNEVLGEAQENPPTPSLDPNTQLFVINVLINAGETTPANTSQALIYDEDVEWDTFANNGNITFDNTTTPLSGTKCINVASSVNNTYFELEAPELQNIFDADGFKFWIKVVTLIPTNRGFKIAFYNGTTRVSQEIQFKRGNNVGDDHGFVYTNTDEYQLVVLPYQEFDFEASQFDKVRFTFINTISVKFDYIALMTSGGGFGTSPDKKAFSKIITDDGIASATTAEDSISIIGAGGASVSAIGKEVTIDITDGVQEANDYTDAGLALKLNTVDYNDRYKGKYTSLGALETAHPTANAGDYAQVDAGSGSDVVNYNYDLEEGWIEGGSGSGATDTDALPEGSTNLYFTTARVLATALAGLSATAGTFTSSDSLLTAFGKIKYLIDNISSTYQVILTDVNFGAFINGLTAKHTPVDADSISIVDSADSNKQKKVSLTNAKVFLKTYNDTLYSPISPTIVETGTSFTLDNTYNGKILVLTASCTVTLPNGLASGFGITIVTLASVTLTLSLGGSVTLFNNAGTTMAQKSSCTIQNRTASNQYITAGNL